MTDDANLYDIKNKYLTYVDPIHPPTHLLIYKPTFYSVILHIMIIIGVRTFSTKIIPFSLDYLLWMKSYPDI